MKSLHKLIALMIIIALSISAGYYFGSRTIELSDTDTYVPSDKFNELEQAYTLQIELRTLDSLKLAEKDSLYGKLKKDNVKLSIEKNKAQSELAKLQTNEQSELFVTTHNVGFDYQGITAVPVQATYVANQNYIELQYCQSLNSNVSEQLSIVLEREAIKDTIIMRTDTALIICREQISDVLATLDSCNINSQMLVGQVVELQGKVRRAKTWGWVKAALGVVVGVVVR